MRRVFAIVALSVAPPVVGAAAPSLPEQAQAILAGRCQSCHGADQQKGGLRLDSREALQAGGNVGSVIASRTPDRTLLIRSVKHADGVAAMPPKETLSKAEIDVLSRWVRGGAAWPAPRPVAAATGDAWTDPANPIRRLFNGQRLDLWSLRRPARPAEPAVRDGAWCRTPVDRFVLARLEAAGLRPSPAADRRTLVRRLTFDLTGLPPTPEEIAAYLADDRPDATDWLINRLIDSPRYGEEAARQWLDVVRYADTNGFERDEFRPQMWRYRDYVVRSFNADKPYDRFVTEQLAGDEQVAGTPTTAAEADALVATGFLRLGTFDSTRALFNEEAKGRDELMADLVNTTGAAFLGLTLSCCNCHDHKYDPLSQADHFRMRAFFAGVSFEDLPLGTAGEVAHGVREVDAAPTRVLFQGDVREPRAEVVAGFPSVFDPTPAVITPPRPGAAGRRTALAKWVTAPTNPYTARVFVNRVWQHYFGTGLVASPDDFGYAGAAPTHPELLDWLATEFVRSGWSVKHLHRLITRSAVYQQASVARGAGVARDPDNQLLWRQNVRRLAAETIRDALLAVSGKLRADAGGPPRWPAVALDVLKAQPGIYEALDGKDGGRRQGWYTTEPAEGCDVRSIYLVRKRSLALPLLAVFDQPDATVTRGRRDVTTIAPQALSLLNNPDVIRLARGLADRVAAETGPDPAERVERAVWLALGRAPTAAERAAALAVLKAAAGPRRPEADPLNEVCRALVNVNEFLYVD